MGHIFTPIYTTTDSVKVRLANKIQFQADPHHPIDGELPNDLLGQLIVDAETKVEQDLRSRYAIPLRSKSKGNFDSLPDHSKRAIRTAVDYKAVVEILSTDFGRGSHISADEYKKDFQEKYDEYITRLLGRDQIGRNDKINRYKVSPPLDDVLLAPSNKEADDGYRGMIINTDASVHDVVSYAKDSIDDPSRSFIRTRGWGGL